MSKREFVEDKVYLKSPEGDIWEFEPLLARRPGWTKVIPNKSKKVDNSAEADAKAKVEAEAKAKAEAEAKAKAEAEEKAKAEAAQNK